MLDARLRTGFIFCLLFFVSSCSRSGDLVVRAPEPPAPRVAPKSEGTLSGQVVNAKGGAPLSGVDVVVIVGEQIVAQTRTNANGEYAISKLQTGNYFVNFNLKTYSSTRAVPIAIVQGRTTVYQALLRLLPGHIAGQVTDALSGRPLAGALVEIEINGGDIPISRTEITDANGNYSSTELPAGSYSLSASLTGYLPARDLQANIRPDETISLNIRLTNELGTLAGHVRDAHDGHALANVTVAVREGSSSSPVLATTQTDGRGNYALANLRPGTYFLDYSLTGYTSVNGRDASVFSSQTTTVNQELKLDRGALGGRVTDANTMAPLSGVRVILRRGEGGPVVADTRTDTKGFYVIRDLTADVYYADFSLANYNSRDQMTVRVGAGATARLDVSLTSALGALTGQVVNSTDAMPLPGVLVTLHQGDGSGPILSNTTTDGSGNYFFSALPAGDYSVDYTIEGYIPVMAAPTMIQNAQTTILNQVMTKFLAEGQFRIVLTWTGPKAGAVQDVDTFLQFPSGRKIWYSQKDTGDGANLDVDDTTWEGPETTTITDVSDGEYIYYVNNYNVRGDRLALGNSEIVVKVYKGSELIKTYHVPQGSGLTYEVFHLKRRRIIDVERYNDSLPVQ